MILMYHKVALESLTRWWVDVDHFYRQLHALRWRKVVYLDDYNPADPAQVVISFDGVYRNVWQFAAPLLQEFNYPFELFVTSDYIGGDNAFDSLEPQAEFTSEDELALLVKSGGRLQWHTRSHPNMKDIVDPVLIGRELDVPEQLRKIDPDGFKWFAYPHGEYSDALLNAVKTRFRGAVSCHQGNAGDPYRFNRLTVLNETVFRKHTVSVIVASYNYGGFLIEALESVLRQTILPDEILISDDASTDNTWEIAQAYQRRYPELVHLNRNEINHGIVSHFNKAVSLTKGDYVCILGADNRLRSDFLEWTTAALDVDDNVAIAYTDFALFGPRATLVAKTLEQFYQTSEVAGEFVVVRFPDFSAEARKRLLNKTNNFIHGSSLFRRRAYEDVGGYMENFGIAEDFNLFSRMVTKGWSAFRCAEPLLEYRQHSRDQANVRLSSEIELQFYKDYYHEAQANIQALKAEIGRLNDYISGVRRSWAWKFAIPVRVLEKLLKRWLKPRVPNKSLTGN
jgi:glycosyltransferase involved in cell wall biosynthesis